MKPTTSTLVRCAVLILALINMGLSALGIVPEDIVGNTKAYEIGSYIITAAIGLIAAWKNNSFSDEAIQADAYLKKLRENGAGKDPAA